MAAKWQKNEPVAAKRRVKMLVQHATLGFAPRETNFMALGYVYISGSGHFALATGTMTNDRKVLVVADDVVESVDTGADNMTLTGHAYETGDGPFTADESIGSIVSGTGFWIIKDDADKIAAATSLANAYAGTRVALAGTETGATISDTADTERGIDGHFTYEASQTETDHDEPETVVIVDGGATGSSGVYNRNLGAGAYSTVIMESSAASVWDQVMDTDGRTAGDIQRALGRGELDLYEEDGSGNFMHKKPDGTDSHGGQITPAGRVSKNIVDLT